MKLQAGTMFLGIVLSMTAQAATAQSPIIMVTNQQASEIHERTVQRAEDASREVIEYSSHPEYTTELEHGRCRGPFVGLPKWVIPLAFWKQIVIDFRGNIS